MSDELYMIDAFYEKYLKLTKLDESKMPAIQREQTKRAFMGGIGQVMLFMRENLGNSGIPEKEAAQILDELFNQVNLYWKQENFKKQFKS